eukprot:CAMPEP_0185042460 /NCGR_PEP_ID=MMETSP1103-20130426/42366_1 /TAXON_ID=36769 /ORGANISM="Paraphysomonas bandaiensis, Strain Caron Lab Isolate" /LENGTH=380 /DNA_ID=CAMNT_0027582539 /DNA_START=999 /DNA_END=2138 /DNA_ORIENTATION=+
MATVQCSENLGELQFLDEHMRASVVDWMVEVSVEFSLAPAVLHCAVQLLDFILACVPVPRSKFQLLGCTCLLIRSRPVGDGRGMGASLPGSFSMSESDVVYMCDSQYSVEEVTDIVTFIDLHKGKAKPNTAPYFDERDRTLILLAVQENKSIPFIPPFTFKRNVSALNTALAPTTLSFLAVLCSLLRLPLVMHPHLEIDVSRYPTHEEHNPRESPTSAEHVLLALFLADLSLIDYAMLQFSPFTIACSVLCLTRLTLHYYSTGQMLLTPYGVADGRSREVKQLIRTTCRRLYIDCDDSYIDNPFGCVWLEKFILSNAPEKRAVRQCVERLWMLHTDYFGHIYHRVTHGDYTPMVLHYHSHMFAGIREKFAARGSNRDRVW